MRIIAGRLKGRRLHSPTWTGVRPTSDRLRETLFNILADVPCEARVLDACAGTGALGLEALSRGACQVVFVDQDPRATALATRNIETCDVASQTVVVRGSLPGIAEDTRLTAPFDLILLDPPYDAPEIGAILSSVARRLHPSGVLVLERGKRVRTPVVSDLHLVRTVMAGDSALDFYGV